MNRTLLRPRPEKGGWMRKQRVGGGNAGKFTILVHIFFGSIYEIFVVRKAKIVVCTSAKVFSAAGREGKK